MRTPRAVFAQRNERGPVRIGKPQLREARDVRICPTTRIMLSPLINIATTDMTSGFLTLHKTLSSRQRGQNFGQTQKRVGKTSEVRFLNAFRNISLFPKKSKDFHEPLSRYQSGGVCLSTTVPFSSIFADVELFPVIQWNSLV